MDALGRDAREARLQRGGIAPELGSLVLGEKRHLLGLRVLFQFTLDCLLELVQHGTDVVQLSLLAGLQCVGRNLSRSFERESTACRMAGRVRSKRTRRASNSESFAVMGCASSSHCWTRVTPSSRRND